jgi:hypothetical protein
MSTTPSTPSSQELILGVGWNLIIPCSSVWCDDAGQESLWI